MDNNEAALLKAADSLVIEALLYSYRRKLPHDFKALSAELLRRLQAARVTVTQTEEVEPVSAPVTVTTPEPTPESKTRRSYPIEVQRLAIDMADRGKSSREIQAAIMERCGRAPAVSNLAKLIKNWRSTVG